ISLHNATQDAKVKTGIINNLDTKIKTLQDEANEDVTKLFNQEETIKRLELEIDKLKKENSKIDQEFEEYKINVQKEETENIIENTRKTNTTIFIEDTNENKDLQNNENENNLFTKSSP